MAALKYAISLMGWTLYSCKIIGPRGVSVIGSHAAQGPIVANALHHAGHLLYRYECKAAQDPMLPKVVRLLQF